MAGSDQPVSEGENFMNEPLQFKMVGGRPRYGNETDKPVEYVAVANEESGLIGYIWVNDADDAASWVERPDADPDSFEGAALWFDLLRHYKAQGLPPSQALARIAEHPGGEVSGRVVAGSRAMASSLAELRRIAGQVEQPPTAPFVFRRGE
jgi:hypothetical protein